MFFFFFQAEDGIRDGHVTGVQTCALPISLEVRGDDENEPPQPAEQAITKMQVRSGEEVSLNILPYWEDPDGDAFYLADATVEPEDIVSRSEEHTSELQSRGHLVCRLLLEKKKTKNNITLSQSH